MFSEAVFDYIYDCFYMSRLPWFPETILAILSLKSISVSDQVVLLSDTKMILKDLVNT